MSGTKRNRQIVMMLVVGLIAFTGGVLAGTGLSSGEARRLIARMGGISLSPDDVHIRNISTVFGSDDVTVEALVQTGFKLTRVDGKWGVTHVRTGHLQWESIELVTAAVEAEKRRRTEADLLNLGQALAGYYADHQAYPPASDFSGLIDLLLPRYLERIIREDHWQQSYEYSITPGGYRILSPGPDRKPGSGDDIVVENGRILGPGPR